MRLIEIIVTGFEKAPGKGLPLGNVTSQLFANVYMDEFDQFAKHVLKVRFYARYCDDFVIVAGTRSELEGRLPKIDQFLSEGLMLELHPQKIELRKARQGIDFLGHVILPYRNVIRTKTKRRILKAAREGKFIKGSPEIASYKGILAHGNNFGVERAIDGLLEVSLEINGS